MINNCLWSLKALVNMLRYCSLCVGSWSPFDFFFLPFLIQPFTVFCLKQYKYQSVIEIDFCMKLVELRAVR